MAPANRHDSPLLSETLDALEALGELPEIGRAYTFYEKAEIVKADVAALAVLEKP